MSNKTSQIQIHPSIFDNLSSDSQLQSIEKLPDKQNLSHLSRTFTLIYTNFTTSQVIPGKFAISQGFLAHLKDESQGGITFLQSLSYARIYKVTTKSYYSSKIVFSKGEQVFELAFSEPQEFDAFLVEIKKICICTDFREKFKILNLLEETQKFKEYLIESNIDGTYSTARVYDKRALSDPQNIKQKRALINEIEALRTLKGQTHFFELQEIHETARNIYLVTEPTHKGTLHDLLVASAHYLSKPTIQRIMFNIFQALSTLSSHGIIHRNIKPSNILIEEDENIKIINFGLAISRSALAPSLKLCGTPGYLAPELLNGGKNGTAYNDKSDVFGAGCIFFEMLYGYPLFEELHVGSLSLNQVTTTDIKQSVFNALSKKENQGDSQSLNLLVKLLEDDPNKRISTNEALKHPYFNSLYKENDNETTVLLSKPLDISSVKHLAQKNFIKGVPRTNTSIESKCFSDDETHDISDEEPEVDTKYQNLNIDSFQKYPSRSSKLSHLLD